MIEQAICTHPSRAGPDRHPGHAYRGEAAKSIVVRLRAGAKPFALKELNSFLTRDFGKHESPAALDFVDELPRAPGLASRRAE